MRTLACLLLLSTVGPALAEEMPRPVISEIVTADPTRQRSFAGTIEAGSTSVLAFQTIGRVASIDVSEGDVVKRGQALASLDQITLDEDVRVADADLASAEATAQAAALATGHTTSVALTQSLLAQYVVARETFDINGLQNQYRKVALWSGDQAKRDYLAQMPLGHTGTDDDVAALVRFLLGPESRWITGQCIGVDGGHSLRRGPNLSPVMDLVFGEAVRPPGPVT